MTFRRMLDPKLVRGSIALVWLYQGLWCKVLGWAPQQKALVAEVPFIGPVAARTFLIALGLIECCIAGWILSGKQMRNAALAQTALIIFMNAGGIIWAGRLIPDVGSMLVQNFAFLVLIWISAEGTPYVVQI